jgi:Bacterial type II/III secretion system short domain
MNRKIPGLLLVISALGCAQSEKQDRTQPAAMMVGTQPPETTKLYRLQYAFAGHVADLLGLMGFVIRGDNGMHAVVVRGTAERQAEAQRLINELDQPRAGAGEQDIETTVYVVAASDGPGSGAQLPSPMEPVVKQLRALFTYSSYQVLGTILMRSRDEQHAGTTGLLKNQQTGSDHKALRCYLNYRASVDQRRQIVHLDDFQFKVDSSGAWTADFVTSLDLREGQKVVVGKNNIDDGSSAIFAIVMARIPDESPNASRN